MRYELALWYAEYLSYIYILCSVSCCHTFYVTDTFYTPWARTGSLHIHNVSSIVSFSFLTKCRALDLHHALGMRQKLI